MATRFCGNCGTEVDDDAAFCPSCGRPIAAFEADDPAAAIPPAPAWPGPARPPEPELPAPMANEPAPMPPPAATSTPTAGMPSGVLGWNREPATPPPAEAAHDAFDAAPASTPPPMTPDHAPAYEPPPVTQSRAAAPPPRAAGAPPPVGQPTAPPPPAGPLPPPRRGAIRRPAGRAADHLAGDALRLAHRRRGVRGRDRLPVRHDPVPWRRQRRERAVPAAPAGRRRDRLPQRLDARHPAPAAGDALRVVPGPGHRARPARLQHSRASGRCSSCSAPPPRPPERSSSSSVATSRWPGRWTGADPHPAGRHRRMTLAIPIERHGLTEDEYRAVVARLGREPNEVELGMFGAMWSEHCAYKHSRALLGMLPTSWRAGPGRAGRERRRARHRRRAGGRLQGRVAQPPERGRALPGRRHRRRRHHPRHLHHGRATDRARQQPALRAARSGGRPGGPDRCRDRGAQSVPVRGRGGRHRRLRQLHRYPRRRRRGRLRPELQRQPARERALPRPRPARGDHACPRRRSRQRAAPRRRGHRSRRHPGRELRIRHARRGGRARGATAGGPGRQPVPREAAHGGLPRARPARGGDRDAGPGRRRADMRAGRGERPGRRRGGGRPRPRAAARGGDGAIRGAAEREPGADAHRGARRPRGGGRGGLRALRPARGADRHGHRRAGRPLPSRGRGRVRGPGRGAGRRGTSVRPAAGAAGRRSRTCAASTWRPLARRHRRPRTCSTCSPARTGAAASRSGAATTT